MPTTRRDFVRLLGAGGVAGGLATALAGCDAAVDSLAVALDPGSDDFRPPSAAEIDDASHVINRLTYGPRPGDHARVSQMGVRAFINEQLHPEKIGDRRAEWKVNGLESIHASRGDLFSHHPRQLLQDLTRAKLMRAVYSRRQLYEVMVDFWTDHFNIVMSKDQCRWLKAADDREVIREHALGDFRTLLRASALSPAMLIYLDGHDNKVARPDDRPNENYARELLELHALGVDGGYTQQDVMEVARCFTGWTVENRPPLTQLSQHDFDIRKLRARGRFRFDPDQHDDGAKQVLGHTIPAGQGEGDARQVVDILAKHPSCARFIARKLCRAFVGTAEEPLVERVADRYTKTDGDIKAMLETLLLSDELLAGPPILKRPFDYVASALRCTYAETDGRAVGEHLRKMGQPLNEWPMPDGYPDGTSEWTGSLLARWNFAAALATGQIRGTKVAFDRLGKSMGGNVEWDRLVCGRPLGLSGDDPAELVALSLCSPEFQWR